MSVQSFSKEGHSQQPSLGLGRQDSWEGSGPSSPRDGAAPCKVGQRQPRPDPAATAEERWLFEVGNSLAETW